MINTEPQRKVAVIVTRATPTGRELAITWHVSGGHQLPAGTVEPGETYADAALRETREETGLDDVTEPRDLGTLTVTAPEPKAFVLNDVGLRYRPDGPESHWRLGRTMVDVLELRDSWALIRFEERDLQDSDSLVMAQLTGWARAADLTRRQERHVFHAESRDPRSEPWQQEAEPGMSFTVSWHPFDDRPTLIPGQEEWLTRFQDQCR